MARRRSRRRGPAAATVIVFQNGAVIVFDDRGQQVPALQGQLADVRERLRERVPEDRWKWRIWPSERQIAAGTAIPAWLEGRARELARARAVSMPVAAVLADNENGLGATVYDPSDI